MQHPVGRPALVVGAGWAGCAAAWALKKKGYQVTLIDKRQELGGRARAFRLRSRGLDLDNGQHLFLGAYQNTARLLKALGTWDKVAFQAGLRVPYFLPGGGVHVLEAGAMPGPWGLMLGVLRLPWLSWAQKLEALSLGIWAGPSLLFLSMGFPAAGLKSLSAGAWLRRCGQGAALIKTMWEPMVLAACNAGVDQAPADLFATVLAQGFLRGGKRASLGFSQAPLSDLLKPMGPELARQGGCLLQGARVESLLVASNKVRGVRLDNGTELPAEVCVLACPAHEAQSLIPQPVPGLEKAAGQPHSPIVSVYVHAKQALLSQPFGAFLDPEHGQPAFHWAFDKGGDDEKGHWHCFVCSAASSLAGQSRENILAALQELLLRYLPGYDPSCILECLVVAEPQATPLFLPGIRRPGQATEIVGLALAGDWTETRLPATIEGAVLSGVKAASLFE
jgi:squalene-associated FAD-dependent desaturase